jgi:hypothetical protein
MKILYDITITIRRLLGSLYDYPCINPNTIFLRNKNVCVVGGKTTGLAEKIIKKCGEKGADTSNSLNEHADILVIIPPPVLAAHENNQTEETYFNVLFHYIKPVQYILPSMLEKQYGQIVFILPGQAVTPSVDYAGTAAFACGGIARGLALEYAEKGIVVNGLVVNEHIDFDVITDWVVFLASGNARNIVGELIDLT